MQTSSGWAKSQKREFQHKALVLKSHCPELACGLGALQEMQFSKIPLSPASENPAIGERPAAFALLSGAYTLCTHLGDRTLHLVLGQMTQKFVTCSPLGCSFPGMKQREGPGTGLGCWVGQTTCLPQHLRSESESCPCGMFLLQPGLHHTPPLPSKFSLCEAERRGADVSRSPTGLHRPLVCLPQLAVSRQGRVLILNRKGEVDPAVVICHHHVTELNMEMNNKNSTPFSNTLLLTLPSVLASPSLGGN